MLNNLRALREDRDLSQKDMAELLHVHQTTYSDYELQAVNLPLSSLIALARYFHTSTDYLLDLTDDPTPYPPKK